MRGNRRKAAPDTHTQLAEDPAPSDPGNQQASEPSELSVPGSVKINSYYSQAIAYGIRPTTYGMPLSEIRMRDGVLVFNGENWDRLKAPEFEMWLEEAFGGAVVRIKHVATGFTVLASFDGMAVTPKGEDKWQQPIQQ